MGGKENAKKVKVKSTDRVNTGCSSFTRETSPFPIYLPLKSCLFCHQLVKLLYLGKKRHPYSNPGVSSMRISHPAQTALPVPLPLQMPRIPRSIPSSPGVRFSLCPPLSSCVPRSLSEYLLVISLEKLQEAGLGASGAFHSPEAQVISDTLQVLKIHAKILNPKTATFPNCGQLSRPGGSQREHRQVPNQELTFVI